MHRDLEPEMGVEPMTYALRVPFPANWNVLVMETMATTRVSFRSNWNGPQTVD